MNFFPIFFLVFSALASPPRTDLGAAGNASLAARFLQYKNGPAICASPDQNKRRVLLSGFGPFSGSPSNISGEILKNFGQFSTPSGDVDAFGVTRDVVIAGTEYQLCFVVAATSWDLAAAILISEAERFAPHFILMTGLGGSSFVLETTGINHAAGINGYDMGGKALDENTPEQDFVLPAQTPGLQETILLSWNAPAAHAAVEKDVTALGFTSLVHEKNIFPDDYICNNIRYVMAHAALNVPIELAGGLVTLNPHFAKVPLTGFTHYPQGIAQDKASLDAWAAVLSGIIDANL